jgi:hypothetical protein
MMKTLPGNTLPRGVRQHAAQKASFSPHEQQRPGRGDMSFSSFDFKHNNCFYRDRCISKDVIVRRVIPSV